jgi:hypothetical protein
MFRKHGKKIAENNSIYKLFLFSSKNNEETIIDFRICKHFSFHLEF